MSAETDEIFLLCQFSAWTLGVHTSGQTTNTVWHLGRSCFVGETDDLLTKADIGVADAFLGFVFMSTGLAGHSGFHTFFGILCLLLVICCTMFVLVIASLMRSTQAGKPPSQGD